MFWRDVLVMLAVYFGFFFFFSSRRRHTRWTGDWSSNVCSSDLAGERSSRSDRHPARTARHRDRLHRRRGQDRRDRFGRRPRTRPQDRGGPPPRRVGTRPAPACGQSSANDPVTISPAGSYVPITTPVVETLLSTSFSPEGTVPSENRRLPDPMTRGKTHRWYSSTRLWRNSVWIRFPLPCTCSSGPS